MRKYTFYIGANNLTKQPEVDKTANILTALYPNGFTLTPGLGVWMGQREPMMLATVLEEAKDPGCDERAKRAANQLAKALDQECVLLEIQEVEVYFAGEAYGKKE